MSSPRALLPAFLLFATVTLAACGFEGPETVPETEVPVAQAQGTLPTDACVPVCTAKQCGDDGCGGVCGTCPGGYACSPHGWCAPTDCQPNCSGKQCGDDGCGGSCGGCPVGDSCDAQGICQGCAPSCTGKQCGDDGCGGSCGACLGGLSCNAQWQCAQCVPACADRECGSDGCGSNCGTCGDGQLCSNDGQCISQGGGCADAEVVTQIPATVTGTTTDAGDALAFKAGTCPGLDAGLGADAPDQVISLVVPDDGPYVFTLEANFAATLYVVADCESPSDSCLAAHYGSTGSQDATVTLVLDAGTTVFAVVDGSKAGAAGEYTLNIHGAGCTPQCDGKECGPDGCGGSCGACTGEGDTCTNTGICIAAEGGCPAAIPIVFTPYTTDGDTTDKSDVLSYSANTCPGETSGWGDGAPEQVYAFTPPEAGTYTVTLSAEFDSNLYVVSDCGDVDGTCFGANDEIGSNKVESVVVALDAGETSYIVVDGWGSGASGAYTLDVTSGGCAPDCDGKSCGDDGCGGSCGACPGGTHQCTEAGICEELPAPSCPGALSISDLPYAHTGDTTDLEDLLGYGSQACPGETSSWGDGAPEQVYEFTAPWTGTFTATLTPEFDSNLYVIGTCEDVDGSCIGANDEVGSGEVETVTMDLNVGETVFVVVDGWGAQVSGAYTLAVAAGTCAPSCGGKSCGPDGCGGSCGSCGPQSNCNVNGSCTAAEPQGTCSDPVVVKSVPYTDSGDTSDLEDSMGYQAGDCPGENSGFGDGAPDQVYAFTAPQTGSYAATLNGDETFDSNLYVLADCENASGSCVGADEEVGKGKEEQVTFTLEMGETVFIVVDGWGSNAAGAYTLTVDVEATCCDVQDGAGCGFGTGCEACVCDDDSYCCETQWDQFCAKAANDTCAAQCGCNGGGGACTPDCADKACGDDGCGGSCGGCGADEVCGPTYECVDADSPCEDGNVCTQDWLIPDIGCKNIQVAAPGCSAMIEINEPARGAMLQGSGDVQVSGTVKLPGGSLSQVTVNGTTIQPAPLTGAFSVSVTPQVGLNIVEVRATSVIGGENLAVRSFTYAPSYHQSGASLTKGTSLHTSPEVWDDNNLWDVDDVATVVTMILEDNDLEAMIPNPLGEYSLAWCTYTIEMTEFSLGDPQVELTPVDGALRAIVSYPDLEVHLHADGSGFGCVNASPKVTADSLEVALYLSATTLADGWVDVSMENEEAIIDNLDIKLSGVAGFLFNWIIDFFEGGVTESFEEQIVQQLNAFPDMLAVAMQQIGFSTTLPLSLPMGGPSIQLDLDAELGEIDFDESGGVFAISTAVAPANNATPYPALGSVARGNCGGGTNAFDFQKNGSIEFAISDDVVNQALFSVWSSGVFEGSVMDLVDDTNGLLNAGIELEDLNVSFLLPPVVSDCGEAGPVLGVGDVRVDATLTVFGLNTVSLELYGAVKVNAQPLVLQGPSGPEVGLKLGQPVYTGVELTDVPEALNGLAPLFRQVITDQVVPKLLDEVGGQVLASYPIPQIPLDHFLSAIPQGTEIALDLEEVYREQGHTVLSGSVK